MKKNICWRRCLEFGNVFKVGMYHIFLLKISVRTFGRIFSLNNAINNVVLLAVITDDNA